MHARTHSLYPFVTVAALVLGGAGAQAQERPADRPSAEMQKLAFMTGRWVSDTGVSREVTWAVKGQYLKIERKATGDASINGLQLIGYDPDAKLYRLWSFGLNGWPVEWVGQFEGERLILTNERAVAALKEHPSARVGLVSTDANPTPEGYWRVNQVIPDSPAAKAGVQAGDLIARIDGHPLKGLTSQQETELELGRRGTAARVTLRRGNQEREVTIVRWSQGQLRRIVEEPRSSGEYSEWGETLVGGRYEKDLHPTVWRRQ